MTSLSTVGLEGPLCVLWHVLLLPDLFALDTVLQVQSPQTRDSDSLVCELAMK